MKTALLLDGDGRVHGVVSGDYLSASHFPGFTLHEVNTDTAHAAKQCCESLWSDGAEIFQVKDPRALWQFLRSKHDYVDYVELPQFADGSQTKSAERRAVKTDLAWDVPRGGDLHPLIRKYGREAVYGWMDAGLTVLKWKGRVLGGRAGDTTIPLDGEREACFWTGTPVKITGAPIVNGDLEVREDPDIEWITNSLRTSNWARKDIALIEIERWLALDEATVVQGFKGGRPVDCKIVRHAADGVCGYISPLSVAQRRRWVSVEEARTLEAMVYQWLQGAGYGAAKASFETPFWETFIGWIRANTPFEPCFVKTEEAGGMTRFSINIDLFLSLSNIAR